MNLWHDIFRLELRRTARDRSLLGLVIIFSLVTGYAAWNGAQWAQERRQAQAVVSSDVAETRERSLSRLRTAEERAPNSNMGVGIPLALLYGPVLPVSALAPLSLGQADSYPHAATLHALRTAHTIFDTQARATIENPAMLAAGRFDLAFVIVFLLPLFLLAGAYDIWTHERDVGTADFILSQPQRPAMVLAAKLLARSGVLLLALILVVLICLLAATMKNGWDASGLAQTALLLMLHGSFWLLIALAVNLRARNSAQAAIACGGVWLVLLIFLPATLAALQDVARPRPSQAAYVNDLRAVELHLKELEEHQPSMQSTATRPQGRTTDPLAHLAKARAEDERFTAVTHPYRMQILEHVRLGNRLRMLAPPVIAQDALDRIAGTDADRALAFQFQTLQFLEQLRTFAADYRSRNPRLGIDEHYRNMPVFQFDEHGGSASLRPDFAALALFNLLLIAVVAAGLRRRWLHGSATGDTR
jgi:ABC-2 type transport system permease protein